MPHAKAFAGGPTPAKARQFRSSGRLAFADAAPTAPAAAEGKAASATRKRVLARTGDVVDHWFFGLCVHDFAGMKSDPRVCFDYVHDDCEVIGYAEAIDVSTGDLWMEVEFTPFHDRDRASEVLAKGAMGVPYQASILMGDIPRFEIVEAGGSAQANGRTFAGPCVIFREWELLGLACCPYGTDSATEIQFEEPPMADAATPEDDKKPEEEGLTDETTTDGDKKPEGELSDDPDKKPEGGLSDGEEKPKEGLSEDDEEKPKGEYSRAEMQAFSKEFGGAKAFEYMEKGFSLARARREFGTHAKGENDKLRAENERLKKELSLGGRPVGVDAAGDKTTVPAAGKFSGLGSNLSRFAAGIKMPGRPDQN